VTVLTMHVSVRSKGVLVHLANVEWLVKLEVEWCTSREGVFLQTHH
jgi:hypothetical protein